MYRLIKRWLIDGHGEGVPQGARATGGMSSEKRCRYGLVAGALGIASNLALFALKMAVGLMSGSVSIVADAINNLSDAGSSIVTVFGFKLSSRPADAEHPFGHARYEYITGFVVAFIVLLIGAELARSSFEKILAPEPIETSVWVFAALALSIAVKLWQAGLYVDFGRDIDSSALKAAAQDSLNDVVATTAVLLSVAAAAIWPGIAIDGFMGLGVSAFIVVSSVRLIKETVDPLLGTVPDASLVDRVAAKVLSYEGVLGIHDLVIHNYGPAACFATLHVEIASDADFSVSHELMDTIERDFLEELNISLVIHMDPIDVSDPETTALRRKSEALLREEIGEDVTLHDFRVVRGPTRSNVLFDVVLPFESKWTRSALVELFESRFNQPGARIYAFILHIDRGFVGAARRVAEPTCSTPEPDLHRRGETP